MSRPDYEKLYKLCFRRYQSLIMEIGDTLEQMDTEVGFTTTDAIETIRRIHEGHATNLENNT